MPAEKWILEPTNLLQRKPPDKFIDDFNTLNQLKLITIVRQLSQLSLISNKLFEELSDDCTKLTKRTIKLNEKISHLIELTSKWNAKKVKIPISSIEKCRSIKDHYKIEQVIDQKLFTNSSRPSCIVQRLEFINCLEKEEKHKPVIVPTGQPEPIYTGLPIKLIKKRKLNLLDIETQQPINVINIKLPRDDIVRRARTPLCKSMVQLHSRPLDDDELTYANLTATSDNLGPLDHLMISSDHPLQKIKDKQELQMRILNSKETNLRTSQSTGGIHQKFNHQRSITNHNLERSTNHLESNHYCCTNISTGLSEMINRSNDFNLNNNASSITSQLAIGNSTITVIKKCSSCCSNNSNLTCTCSSLSNEPIYMLPSLKEQTEALSLEYPSNVVAINTDQIQFTRMSSFRKSLIHSDFCIKRKKLKLGKENSCKLKRRNTICESTCHQRNCNLVHCSKKKCCNSKASTNINNRQNGDPNSLKSDKQNERRRSTGSINLIDSCCQTDLTLGSINLNSQSTNRLTSSTGNRRSINRKQQPKKKQQTSTNTTKMNNQVKIKADVHKIQEPMYEKIKKGLANEDERSSSGNWSTSSSAKSPTQTEQQNKDVVKRNSYSACSLSNDQQSTDLCKSSKKNNSETNVINNMNKKVINTGSSGFVASSTESGLAVVQFSQSNLGTNSTKKFSNRDSESWIQFFKSNESTDTITNEKNSSVHNEKAILPKDIRQRKLKLQRKPRNELDSISNENNLEEEHEDELLSIHSLDTDGYYTSMHTDSGLFRERAQQLPLNSTFLSTNDEDDQQVNKENQSSNELNQQQSNKQTNYNSVKPEQQEFINTLKKSNKKSVSAPSPPLRSCSVISNASTLNNIQQLTTCMSNQTNYDQDNSSVCSDATLSGQTNSSSQQLNLASLSVQKTTNKFEQNKQIDSITSPSPANTWCSSMNSDIDLVKLRNKVTIDPTSAYPSMVAYPESELSSISSFGNLAFASSGNHRCTVIGKSKSATDTNQQFTNYTNNTNQHSNTSYVNGNHSSLSKKESTSSLDSKISKRSLSTIGSYASLTKLKELLKPLRNTLIGQKSADKKANNETSTKKKQSKDDCLTDGETKSNKRKGFFTRFGSINRGKIVKSNHLQKTEKAVPEQDELIKLRNTINEWRIEPLTHEMQVNKILNNKTKDTSKQEQFAEEDENEYYAKLSQQSNNVLRNSVDFSLNNDLKRFSIASNHSQQNYNSYLYKKHCAQTTSDRTSNFLSSSLNQPHSTNNQSALNKEKRRSADAALFTKFFPISRYTSKVQPEENQFIVPSLPIYYENLANTRFSYASDSGCSNSLALSNNSSALYATIPARPKTLNLSASLTTSFNQPILNVQQQPIYGQQILSNSYNCSFNNSSLNRPFLNNNINYHQPNGHLVNGQSLNSSTSSSFYSNQILSQNTIPTNNFNNVNVLTNNHLNQQPLYQQPIHQNPQNHISSSSSHQSTSSSSYNYLSSASSSIVNTPSSMSSSSPFHHQLQQTSQLNQIKTANSNQSRNLASSLANTAIVSPFCKQIIQSTDSLKSEEKLNKTEVNLKDKRSTDDSVLDNGTTLNNQIIFRDSMRLTRMQREQTLARIQRSSWTPSSSMISSPSGSLGSSSNSSGTDQPCNINKLINELTNFDAQKTECNQEEAKKLLANNFHLNGKSDPIYGVNIARTKFSFPIVQNENAIKGDMNVFKQQQQSNGTNINDFKKLLSTKASTQVNGTVKKTASEQLKIARKPLNATLCALESVQEKLNGCSERVQNTVDYYEKETYDNVTDEEYENQQNKLDYSNNSSIVNLINGQTNGFNNLRTRIINGRVYKTPYRLEAMMYPPINEEDNVEEGDFIVTNNQQKTSTWV